MLIDDMRCEDAHWMLDDEKIRSVVASQKSANASNASATSR